MLLSRYCASKSWNIGWRLGSHLQLEDRDDTRNRAASSRVGTLSSPPSRSHPTRYSHPIALLNWYEILIKTEIGEPGCGERPGGGLLPPPLAHGNPSLGFNVRLIFLPVNCRNLRCRSSGPPAPAPYQKRAPARVPAPLLRSLTSNISLPGLIPSSTSSKDRWNRAFLKQRWILTCFPKPKILR